MSQFDRFIDNLVEMRSHYSKQIQQSDRSINLAQDSLTHINALLINELSGNQPFVENLTQMKSHYQSIIEENDRASGSNRIQLNHINALLAEQLILQQGNEQAIPLQASFINDESAIAGKMGGGKATPVVFTGVENLSDGLPTAHPFTEAELLEVEDKQPLSSIEELQPETQSSPDEFAAPSNFVPENESQNISVEFIATEQLVEDEELTEDDEIISAAAIEDSPLESRSAEEAATLEEDSLAVEPTKKARKPLKQALLPQYEHLSKSEAVEKLL